MQYYKLKTKRSNCISNDLSAVRMETRTNNKARARKESLFFIIRSQNGNHFILLPAVNTDILFGDEASLFLEYGYNTTHSSYGMVFGEKTVLALSYCEIIIPRKRLLYNKITANNYTYRKNKRESHKIYIPKK